MTFVKLAPENIRYTQDSISRRFKNGSLVREVLDDLVDEKLYIEDIPALIVMEKEGQFFSYNNRMLWVLKQYQEMGKCTTVKVKKATKSLPYDFTTNNGGKEVRIRGGGPGGSSYFDLLRGDYNCESSDDVESDDDEYEYDDCCNEYDEDITALTVMEKEGQFFYYNNKRLWVLKQYQKMGKCKTVKVKKATKCLPHDFTANNGRKEVRIRCGGPGVFSYFDLLGRDSNCERSDDVESDEDENEYADDQPNDDEYESDVYCNEYDDDEPDGDQYKSDGQESYYDDDENNDDYQWCLFWPGL